MDRAPAPTVWRHTRELARPVRNRYLGAALAVIAATLITLAGPFLVRYAVDAGIKKHDRGPLDTAALIFLFLALAKPLVVRAQVLLAASAGERFLGALRTAAFDKLQALPLGFFERERAGLLMSRLTSDVQALTEFVREALVEVAGSALQILLTVVALLFLSPKLAAAALVALPILVASSWSFHHGAGRAYHAIRDRVAETLTALQEGLAGVRVVQAFRRERRTLERYRPRSRAQVGAWRHASFVNIRLFPIIALAQTAALIAVLLVAFGMYRRGEISEGTIAAFVLFLVQLFDPVARLSEWLGDFRQGVAALAKVIGLLEAPSAIVEKGGAVDLPERGAVALPSSSPCTGASSCCRRRDICSAARSRTTSGSHDRRPPRTRSQPRSTASGLSTASVRSRTGSTPTSSHAGSAFPRANGSSSVLRASRWRIRP